MISPSTNQARYPYQNESTWSRSEKAIARIAFDAALGRELPEVIQRAKQMAGEIQQSTDLWDLERYLTQHRKKIDVGTTSQFAIDRCIGETLVRKANQRGRSAGTA